MHRAYLSLGSNIEPEKNLRAAIAELRAEFGALIVSPVYRSVAVGFDGPEFLNLAIGLDTDADVRTLDAWLHALEDRHGRHRDQPRYASRTLDVDIVLFDEAIVRGPGNLRIPRPELREAFVNVPLADIAPDVRDPETAETIADIRNRTDASGLVRIAFSFG